MVRGFVSVYVDWAATEDQVRAATAQLPKPADVFVVKVVALADTFGCRIAVDLTGGFDEKRDGRRIARAYAAQLSEALAVPAFALHDLILGRPFRVVGRKRSSQHPGQTPRRTAPRPTIHFIPNRTHQHQRVHSRGSRWRAVCDGDHPRGTFDPKVPGSSGGSLPVGGSSGLAL